MGGECSAYWGREKHRQSFGAWVKPGGKIQLWRHRRKWEDNIKMDLQEVGCGGME